MFKFTDEYFATEATLLRAAKRGDIETILHIIKICNYDGIGVSSVRNKNGKLKGFVEYHYKPIKDLHERLTDYKNLKKRK